MNAASAVSLPVYDWLAQVRNLGWSLTNLFPDDRKITDWLAREAITSFDGTGGCRLLTVQEDGFVRLFYAAESIEAAAKACRVYADMHGTDCILDVVGLQPVQLQASVAFANVGFSVRKTLTRMQRRVSVALVGSNAVASRSPRVRASSGDDAVTVHAALHRHFDVRSEQLPCFDEVKDLCTSGASFVTMDEDGIPDAFLLGEIQGKKGTVRYWFTIPSARGKGVGGALMQSFFNRCQDTGSTYQELWVLDDNENAIKRYGHYGFTFDRLKDTVFERTR